MITEKDAIDLIMLAEELEINVFIDGGWGVDALLGEQTREHQDIDLFVEERQAVRFIYALHQQGFKERTETYSTPQHIVFADADGRTVDLHLFTYTSERKIVFEGTGQPAGGGGRAADNGRKYHHVNQVSAGQMLLVIRSFTLLHAFVWKRQQRSIA